MWVGLSAGRSTPWIRGMGYCSSSALTLLVPRVHANDADHALPTDELALVAHPPDARSYLHDRLWPSSGEKSRNVTLRVGIMVARHFIRTCNPVQRFSYSTVRAFPAGSRYPIAERPSEAKKAIRPN